MLAPIILFTYNRLNQSRKTVESLLDNNLADSSELFIYSDGAKSEKDLKDVQEVREFLKSIEGFKKTTIIEQKVNKGLAKSIVEGVTEITKKYGKVIVLEDDIVTSVSFLKFMNDALDFYENEPSVMHISGYMYPHKRQLPSTFFFNVPLCWGWATWARAWNKYNDDANAHISFLEQNNLWRSFNKFGGKYLERQLRKNQTGKMNTWFIYWHATVFRQGGYSLYPGETLVDNIGFDKSGQHKASTNKFYSPVSKNNVEVTTIPIEESKEASIAIKRFYLIRRNSLIRKLIGAFKKIIS
jgi:GT2 family glycosyltransferase